MTQKLLVISDTHFPFAHPSWYAFLSKLKAKYKPNLICHIGDETDMQSINISHTINPDLPSPKDELELAKKDLHKLYKLFPKMTLLESNHGSMVLRRAMAKYMSREFIKSYNDIYEVGKGWEWKEKHFVQTKKGRIMLGHQFSADVSKAVKQFSMSIIQGHFHCSSTIVYEANDFHLNFGATIGCLVDKHSLSMAYMKLNMKKPILSCLVVTDGIPKIVPMLLRKNGDWDNNIYL